MLLRLGSVPVVVVSSADAAREIMKANEFAFLSRPKSISAEKLLYNYRDIGSAPYGEYWRQAKSVCVLQLLSTKRVRSFRRVREEETNIMTEKIRQQARQNPSSAVNMSELFARLTNDVVARVSLGKKFGDDDGQRDKFNELFMEFREFLWSFNVGDYIPMLSWVSRVSGLAARMDKVAKKLDEFLEEVVEEHMRSVDHNNGSSVGDEDKHKNFTDILLWIQRENLLGFPIDRTCVKAIIWDMFAAGTDTTYTVLEWAMTELLRNPNAMEQLRSEIRAIVDSERDVVEDDLEKMSYLKAVLKETLRLHPPFPLLVPRLSTQDVKIKGYDVEPGSQVLVNAWAIGRDPSLWGGDAEEFRPERFLSSKVDYKGQHFELIPFGAGRRICPAILFAMAVYEIALANVVHKFDWSKTRVSDLDMKVSSHGLAKMVICCWHV